MTKDDLIKYAALSVGVVIGARFFANAAFAWIEEFLFNKSKDEKNLDDLIRSKRYGMGDVSEKERKKISAEPSPKERPLELGREVDPREADKAAMMHRIYDLVIKRGAQESEEDFYLRLLGLSKSDSPEIIKRAFKQKAKEFHPDMFVLDGFDGKTRKRLEARIHENYVMIQKAHDFLKKK